MNANAVAPLKFGVIGAGLIGGKRAEAFRSLGCDGAAVYDMDKERAAMHSARFGSRVVSSVEELVDTVGVGGIVIVAASHASLSPLAVDALEGGCHVLVEKPGGLNSASVFKIMEAAAAAGRHVQVGYNHRFHPAVRAARSAIADRRLGKPILIRGVYGHGGRAGYEKEWRFQRDISGGGELLDQGSHLIDLANFLLNGKADLQYSSLSSLHWGGEVEDNAFLHLRERALGVEIWLHASWTEWKNKFQFEIFCERGKLVVDSLGGSYGPEVFRRYEMLSGYGPPEIKSIEYAPGDQSWRNECEDFIGGVNGKAFSGASLAAASNVMEVVDGAYQE